MKKPLVVAALAAQSEKVSLSVAPSPGRLVHYRMTNEMDVEVTPEVDAGAAMPPMKITGHSALASRSAARAIASSSSGASGSFGNGATSSTSALAPSTSGGTSSPTGRARPGVWGTAA